MDVNTEYSKDQYRFVYTEEYLAPEFVKEEFFKKQNGSVYGPRIRVKLQLKCEAKPTKEPDIFSLAASCVSLLGLRPAKRYNQHLSFKDRKLWRSLCDFSNFLFRFIHDALMYFPKDRPKIERIVDFLRVSECCPKQD